MQFNTMVPFPVDFKILAQHSQFAEKHGKSLPWLSQQLQACREWNKKKGIQRTEHGWNRHFTNWLRQAIIYESEAEAGRAAYSNSGNAAPVRQPVLPPLDGREIFEHHQKYKQMLKDDPAAAKRYREKLPDRIRRFVND